MADELVLYRSLCDSSLEKNVATAILNEVKESHSKIPKKQLFKEQSIAISKINKALGSGVFTNFVPSYKSLANIYQMLNANLAPKQKIMLEQAIVDSLTQPISETTKENTYKVDKTVVRAFTKKYNEEYSGSLIKEQKELIKRYISSYDDKIEYKVYLNEEIGRLKEATTKALELESIKEDPQMVLKTQNVLEVLNDLANGPIAQEGLNKILMIQEFIHEAFGVDDND